MYLPGTPRSPDEALAESGSRLRSKAVTRGYLRYGSWAAPRVPGGNPVHPGHRNGTKRAVLMPCHPVHLCPGHRCWGLGGRGPEPGLRLGRSLVRRPDCRHGGRRVPPQDRCRRKRSIAYVLTRPFGASCGDLLSQPVADGGLGLGAEGSTALFLVTIVGLVGLQAGLHGLQGLGSGDVLGRQGQGGDRGAQLVGGVGAVPSFLRRL